MWKGKHVVLSRIDAHRRGLNGGICSKKVALPNSWVFSQLSPGGGGYFPPVVPWVAAIIKLNPTTLACSLTNAD